MFLMKDDLFIGFLFQTNSLFGSVCLNLNLYLWEKEMEGGAMHSVVVLGNAAAT